MFPDLFGVHGLTMCLLIVVGILVGCGIIFLYLKRFSYEKKTYLDLIIVFIFTLISAFIFAVLFENLYESIKSASLGKPQQWTWSTTFYGGLFGGIVAFTVMYRFFYLRTNTPILDKLLVIVPGAISLGHAIGRLGCFLNGCCYGKETDKWYGVIFPGNGHKVIPTQLLEMLFLLTLAAVLIYLAFKKNTKYTLPIYLLSYGTFRFLIEFIRDDERGQFLALSPSQYWSILLVVAGVVAIILFKKNILLKGKTA